MRGYLLGQELVTQELSAESNSQLHAQVTGRKRQRFRYPSAARSSSAMSNFVIRIIASIPLGLLISSARRAGTTCQHKPNLSRSHPQAISLPPSVSFAQ